MSLIGLPVTDLASLPWSALNTATRVIKENPKLEQPRRPSCSVRCVTDLISYSGPTLVFHSALTYSAPLTVPLGRMASWLFLRHTEDSSNFVCPIPLPRPNPSLPLGLRASPFTWPPSPPDREGQEALYPPWATPLHGCLLSSSPALAPCELGTHLLACCLSPITRTEAPREEFQVSHRRCSRSCC